MFKKISLHCVLNLCKNKIDIDVPKNLDINQKVEKCCVCENSLDENILMPSQCFTINGTRGNRICIDCWFNKFAMENKSHKCPGCDKKRNGKIE